MSVEKKLMAVILSIEDFLSVLEIDQVACWVNL